MNQKLYLTISLLIMMCAKGQRNQTSHFDSLSTKSYQYLQTHFENTIYNKQLASIYSNAWLQKAKAEKDNFLQLTLAYKATIINAPKSERTRISDSMLINALKTKREDLIASSYMTRGIIHYDNLQHKLALDNYLIANQYLTNSSNLEMVYKIKYGIAQIKYYLGFYGEAISLLRECVAYYEVENDRAYLNSLHALSLNYTRVSQYKWAAEIVKKGIAEGRELEHKDIESYFVHSDGINDCYLGNYNDAIKKLSAALPDIIKADDYANEALSYFYIGKSLWLLNRHDEAVAYFKKVDVIFRNKNYTLPDLRKGYEYLIDYYKTNKDTELQLLYINQLLKVDNVLNKEYKYLLKKVVKEYDTAELLSAKKSIENTIVVTRISAVIIIFLLSAAIFYLIHRNRRNIKKFNELMNRDTKANTTSSQLTSSSLVHASTKPLSKNDENKTFARDMTPRVEAAILIKLEEFEANKGYLQKELTLAKMSTILQTNPRYVTKIIAKHRGKGTIDYIIHQKLNYIIELIKNNSRYRNYTNKALAEEAGFRTTQHFTREFKLQNGISPTYFISRLKKSLEEGSNSD